MESNSKMTLKSKIGIGLVIFGFVLPVFGLVVPLLDLDTALTTTLVAFFMVGGPEIFLLLGAALAGKEGVLLVKNRVKRVFGLPEGRYAASKRQYEIGLTLMLVWFPLSIIPSYIPGMMALPAIQDNLIWWSVSLDLLFIIGLFGFGGHQMITKVGRIFQWEPWELPPEKE